jgi:hypothetical protein
MTVEELTNHAQNLGLFQYRTISSGKLFYIKSFFNDPSINPNYLTNVTIVVCYGDTLTEQEIDIIDMNRLIMVIEKDRDLEELQDFVDNFKINKPEAISKVLSLLQNKKNVGYIFDKKAIKDQLDLLNKL